MDREILFSHLWNYFNRNVDKTLTVVLLWLIHYLYSPHCGVMLHTMYV